MLCEFIRGFNRIFVCKVLISSSSSVSFEAFLNLLDILATISAESLEELTEFDQRRAALTPCSCGCYV